jgi:hypothetical protein
MVGYAQDLFLFGLNTHFAPEETFIKSRLPRFALAYRVRRAILFAKRAIIHNDVALGWFWFGWHETKWTPSGYDGWTNGKPRSMYPRVVASTATAEVAETTAAPATVPVLATSESLARQAPVLAQVDPMPVLARAEALEPAPASQKPRTLTLAPPSKRRSHAPGPISIVPPSRFDADTKKKAA